MSQPRKGLLYATVSALALLFGAGIALVLMSHSRQAGQEGMPVAHLSLLPATSGSDPGPQWVAGADAHGQDGQTYFWTGITVREDEAVYRIYFDRQNAEHYHFLEKRSDPQAPERSWNLTLGYCEGGVEQILGRGHWGEDEEGPLRVARHGAHIGVFVGPRLALWAYDARALGGTVGVRSLLGKPQVLDVEAHDEILLQDDFMREKADTGAWRCAPGAFEIKSLENPVLSQNAFYFFGTGQNEKAIIGALWWDNYRYRVSLRGPEGSRIGLVFAYRDEANYGLFRWTATEYNRDGTLKRLGSRELVKVQNGREEILAAEDGGGFAPDQWYAAVVHVGYADVRVTIDGHDVFEVHDANLSAGAVGLWCDVNRPVVRAPDPHALSGSTYHNSLDQLMRQFAVFDDVQVRSSDSFEDDFRDPPDLAGGWLAGPGRWLVKARPGVAGWVEAPGSGTSKALIGRPAAARYQIACEVALGAAGAGLVFHYRDEQNCYLVRLGRDSLQLKRFELGRERLIDECKLAPMPNGLPGAGTGTERPYQPLRVRVHDGHLVAECPGRAIVEGFEKRPLRGRVGMWTEDAGGMPAAFRKFRMEPLEESKPLITTNAIYEEEATMQDWTRASWEWARPAESFLYGKEKVDLRFHRGQFPGDVEMTLEPREIQSRLHEVALTVAGGEGSEAQPQPFVDGYLFRYRGGQPRPDGSEAVVLELFRAGQVVAQASLSEREVRELASLSLARYGPFVVAKVNGKAELAWRDPHPLPGVRLAYFAKGLAVRDEATRIHSGSLVNETFSAAPTGWRWAGAAIAEITSRWDCDTRWTFFTLRNDLSRGKPAVLWCKRRFPGDVAVEWFAANKLETERRRDRSSFYSYARDINLTIGSDGHDLSKGYTFMFGGMDNRGSMILRNGKIVAQNDAKIPTNQSFHQNWFYLRAERHGGKISFYTNLFPGPPLVFEDPEPLTGSRLALWTFDHAMVVSRVRISGDGDGAIEDPSRIWPPVVTPYENELQTTPSRQSP